MLVAAVLHDPNLIVHKRYRELADHALFKNSNFFLVTSKSTPSEAYYDDLHVIQQPGYGIADARRFALQYLTMSQDDLIFLLDFDRLLFWLAHYPDELDAILYHAWVGGISQPTVYGRTEAAIMSHPQIQRATEMAAVGHFYNKLFDERHPAMDFFAGCYLLPRFAAKYITDNSHADEPGAVDVEWQALLHFGLTKVNMIRVDGLAYEGVWAGLEPEHVITPEDIVRKRQRNLHNANSMTDIIHYWRQL